ncbi:MAG: PAS domain-containing protein [Polaromonas sp.]
MSRFLDRFRPKLSGHSPEASLPAASSALPSAPPGWGALDLTLDGIVLLDDKGNILDANARALELLHSALPTVSGYDFWRVVPQELATQHQQATGLALSSSARHSFLAGFENSWVEYTFRRHARGDVVNLREAGSTQRLKRLLEDSNRYNQLIFEANPNAMWVFDLASLRICAVNQAAVKFYGIARKVFMTLAWKRSFPRERAPSCCAPCAPAGKARKASLKCGCAGRKRWMARKCWSSWPGALSSGTVSRRCW